VELKSKERHNQLKWLFSCLFYNTACTKYFSQLLNVQRARDVRQTETHTAEPLVPDHGPLYFETAIAKLKLYKSQLLIKFRQNLFKQEVKHYGLKSMNSLILFGIRKNCLISGRSLLLYQVTRRVIKLTVVITCSPKLYECINSIIRFKTRLVFHLTRYSLLLVK
jgi:hypothetical protein